MSSENDPIPETHTEGAPAWVVTFSDLMSLLLCFFVLMLSFSEMDKAKYKEVAGSLAKAFGVQRVQKAFQAPKGVTMIARDFDQQPLPTNPREEFVAMQRRQEVGRKLKTAVEERFRELKDLIQVEVNRGEVTIRLMGETAFDSGRAEIRPQMIPLLQKIGEALADAPGDVVIAGHTDNVPVLGGPYRSNLKLSTARAAAVAEYLLQHAEIAPQRVATMGFGKYRPFDTNATLAGRRRNRRVEIVLRQPEKLLQSQAGGGSETPPAPPTPPTSPFFNPN